MTPEDSGRFDEYLRDLRREASRPKEFAGFSKIPRWNRETIITEKIDGTNAQVLITEDELVVPGSRKRYLTLDADNYGFAAWVKEHEDELRQLGPGRHFGEWWGQGIQRRYGLDHKRFSLFNVGRWKNLRVGGIRLPDTAAVPDCCDVVPILEILPSPDAEGICDTLEYLRQQGSEAAPGFDRPEGIVIHHAAANQLFKITIEGDEKPKSLAPFDSKEKITVGGGSHIGRGRQCPLELANAY